jgi:hypothetical protein
MVERSLGQRLESDQSFVSNASYGVFCYFLVDRFNDQNLSVDSIKSMKAQLPKLRKKLNEDPEYFKRVYVHAFVMSLQPGARVLALDSGKRST